MRREVTPATSQFNPVLRQFKKWRKSRDVAALADVPRRFSIMHSHILPKRLVAFSDERDDSCRTAFTRLTIIQRDHPYASTVCTGCLYVIHEHAHYCLTYIFGFWAMKLSISGDANASTFHTYVSYVSN